MKQLLVLSGKGGTGKTTVAGALIELARCKACADCDVDAPNLHLILSRQDSPEVSDFYGLGKAVIDPEKCVNCGLCEEHCRFGAIREAKINPFACEGCAVCVGICPTEAVSMTDVASGSLTLYREGQSTFSSACLKMGSGASGKLVAAVKKQLHENLPESAALSIVDGSPGIGCPVIASVSGADLVLLVAEPSVSGIHDLKRIAETARHFGVPCVVCINKDDQCPESTAETEKACEELDIPVIGRIPFDPAVVRAVNRCESIARYPESPAGKAVADLWDILSRDYL